jgi:hypothetical protein
LPLPAVPEDTWRTIPHGGAGRGSQFSFLVGEELVAFYESTPGTHRGFCKVCGAPVLVKFDEHSRGAQTDPRAVTLYGIALATRTRLSSTWRRGSRSPTTCLNTQRVSLSRTHHTTPDWPIAAIAR